MNKLRLVLLGSEGFEFIIICRYPFNNALHHHVESIIYSCLESRNDTMMDHLFQDCSLITKIQQADNYSTLNQVTNQLSLYECKIFLIPFKCICNTQCCVGCWVCSRHWWLREEIRPELETWDT